MEKIKAVPYKPYKSAGDNEFSQVVDELGNPMGEGGGDTYYKTEEANILAAAPDLLEALEDVILWIENWSPEFTEDPEWQLTSKLYQTAIAKAKGKA